MAHSRAEKMMTLVGIKIGARRSLFPQINKSLDSEAQIQKKLPLSISDNDLVVVTENEDIDDQSCIKPSRATDIEKICEAVAVTSPCKYSASKIVSENSGLLKDHSSEDNILSTPKDKILTSPRDGSCELGSGQSGIVPFLAHCSYGEFALNDFNSVDDNNIDISSEEEIQVSQHELDVYDFNLYEEECSRNKVQENEEEELVENELISSENSYNLEMPYEDSQENSLLDAQVTFNGSNKSDINESTDVFEDGTISNQSEQPTSTLAVTKALVVKKKNKKTLRNWDRKNFCIFCRSLVTNFRRHQLRHHQAEKEVQEFLAEKHSDLKERKRRRQIIFDDLRKRGNYFYNSTNSDINRKEILPIRRPVGESIVTSLEKYVTCIYCLGTYRKKTFYRHIQKCPQKPQDDKLHNILISDSAVDDEDEDQELDFNVQTQNKNVLKSCSKIITNQINGNEELKSKIFPIINKDKIGLTAMSDSLIISLASQFLSNHRDKKDEYSVTKKMRDAAKLLLYCKTNDPEIKHFEDCLQPMKFDLVIKAVQHLSGFDSTTGNVAIVGMPARMAYVIQESAKIVADEAIVSDSISRRRKDVIKTEISEFLQLFRNKWKFVLSTNAEKTRKKLSSTKPVVMPDDNDIKIIVEQIKEKEETYFSALKMDVNFENYENLCKICIGHIIILNRRRPGEVARAELFNYINRSQNDNVSDDVLDALTESEIKALPYLTLFMVPGKLVRSVPILLTRTMKACVDLLLECRSKLGIPKSNKLLFARCHTDYPFDGSKIIRDFKKMCHLKKPEHLTATGLRHHIATKTQIRGDDSYTEKVCQHLGHTKEIHKQNYRFPIEALQKGQVGHQLLQMDGTWEEITGATKKRKEESIASTSDTNWNIEEVNRSDSSLSEDEKRNKRKRKRWSQEEKEVVINGLSYFFKTKTNPGKLKCEELLKKNPSLKGRTWAQVNSLVNNYLTGKIKIPTKFRHLFVSDEN